MSRTHSSWREDLVSALEENGETMDQIEHSTPPLDSPDMTRRFSHSYGGTEGCCFTVWTGKNVYFPVCYDGAEWIGSVPRNPCDRATGHHGGG